MKDCKEHIRLFVAEKGIWIGLVIVFSPAVRDLIYHGAREFNLVSIGNIGVLIQILGGAIMWVSWYVKKNY